MSRKLNVCLMNDSFPPVVDGVATCVANYAAVIEKELGHSMVCTPYYPNVTDNYPFPVFRYPSLNIGSAVQGYRAGMPFNTKLLDKLRTQSIDIIHSHCPIMSTFLARTLRESIHKPIVLTYHTKFDIDIQNSISIKSMQKTAIRLLVANVAACDEVWVVSHGAGENLRSLGYEGDYVLMENGVDFPKGRADDAKIRALNGALSLAYDEPVFLFVGRMMWYKGIKTTLDGLRIAKVFGAKFTMLFVGDGADKDAIIEYAKSIGVDDVCRFLPATHDREHLRTLYSRADLFLFPSDFDTNGLVVREAAACGTASLVLANSCAAEGITNERNGLLIQNDAADLARCVYQITNAPARAGALGEHAMNEIYLSWKDAIFRAYERYQVVLDKYKPITDSERPVHRGDDFFRMMSILCSKPVPKKKLKRKPGQPRHKVYHLKRKDTQRPSAKERWM